MLLDWLDKPSDERGIHFSLPGGDWDFWPYSKLAGAVNNLAKNLIDRGIQRNDVVVVVRHSSPEFVAAFFGVMLAGAVPSPVAPPMVFRDLGEYERHLEGLLRRARPAAVLTGGALVSDLAASVLASGTGDLLDVASLLSPPADGNHPGLRPAAGPADLALLQFTSGSTGYARGVEVPFRSLEANIDGIRTWLRWGPDDPTASWLPVHHDMGLIGCLVTPVVSTSDLWLLTPEEFLHRPQRYLECFGKRGARLTAMPNFGLDYIARRVGPDDVAGWDFSQWRAVIVGAERIQAGSLERFLALLSPAGLKRTSLLPAYGLAEATLAVTGLPLDEEWSRAVVAPGCLALDADVARSPGLATAGPGPATAGPGPATAGPGPAATAGPGPEDQEVVGCGRALLGSTVAVVDEAGSPVPDGRIGEIVVTGPSVALGYRSDGEDHSDDEEQPLFGGRLHTGDAGFLIDGQLYVLGRLGDGLKIRGRMLFAEDLESALVVAGIPAGFAVVLLGEREGIPTVVALFERVKPGWLEAAEDVLRRRGEGAAVEVRCVARGTIARTSSGKPKRRQLWRTFAAGELAGAAAG